MGVDIPNNYTIALDLDGQLDVSGNVEADLRIPTSYSIGINQIPKIQLGIDPVELRPVDLSLRIKEIPQIRMHLPAYFTVGLSVLGMELLSVKLCGEAQVITEDYVPNPCETCAPGRNATSGSTVGRLDLDGEPVHG